MGPKVPHHPPEKRRPIVLARDPPTPTRELVAESVLYLIRKESGGARAAPRGRAPKPPFPLKSA